MHGRENNQPATGGIAEREDGPQNLVSAHHHARRSDDATVVKHSKSLLKECANRLATTPPDSTPSMESTAASELGMICLQLSAAGVTLMGRSMAPQAMALGVLAGMGRAARLVLQRLEKSHSQPSRESGRGWSELCSSRGNACKNRGCARSEFENILSETEFILVIHLINRARIKA